MWVVTFFAGLLSLIVANSFYTDYMAQQIPWNSNEAARDAGNFHVFATAAALYMRDHAADTNFLPLGTTGTSSASSTIGAVVRWTTYTSGGKTVQGLNQAKGLPAALASNTSIDSTWRIRIISSDSYLLCTGMATGGVVKMSNLPESPLWNPSNTWKQRNLTVSNGSNPVNAVQMVTFDVDGTDAAQCRCDPTMTSGATQCL